MTQLYLQTCYRETNIIAVLNFCQPHFLTSLQILNTHSTHNKSKSRELITGFNRYELAITYNKLHRYHNDSASFIVRSSPGNVPSTSQFDPKMFTLAACDKVNHEKATLSCHCNS